MEYSQGHAYIMRGMHDLLDWQSTSSTQLMQPAIREMHAAQLLLLPVQSLTVLRDSDSPGFNP